MDHTPYDHKAILAHFHDWDLDTEGRDYLRFHAKRYSFLLDVLGECVNTVVQETGTSCDRILDVGPSVLTQFIRDKNIARNIDSLGFQDHRFKRRQDDVHIEYDLTKAVETASWPQTSPYDIVVMAEVIEHLPISPSHVFAFLSGLLDPRGFLIIQTPNACSLPKRLRMLRGQNPYEMIRESQQNPGHFREYTVRELAGFAQANGFLVHSVSTANYFLRNTWTSRAFRCLGGLFPVSMRDGITMCMRKKGANS